MPTKLDGKAVAAALKDELRDRVAALRERGIEPGLGTLLVGRTPARSSMLRASTRTAPRSASGRFAVTCRQTRTSGVSPPP